MTAFAHVRIGRRFQRAIRIDSDLGNAQAIDGFICPPSSAEALLAMARHVSETGQGAFTWTGPYGSGKSSLAVALAALLNGNKVQQARAADVFGRRIRDQISKALPPHSKGWRILPVLGRRDRPARVIGEALESFRFVPRNRRREWTNEKVIAALSDAAAWHPRSHGGLIVIIDEMGKFLEAAAHEGWDIYIFQQLAEIASRSNSRLVVVGILHQAFEGYAHRLSRDMRDEWAKIQGRYVDLALTTTGEEQIELLSRAIESDRKPSRPGALAESIAAVVRRNRTSTSQTLALALERCWPLHAAVACLLGPISRRRFGQNQRSIFAFLNSAEPHGFQDFLRSASVHSLYEPVRLWDYLRANLESSILASPDGHRWALAVEAIERCEGMRGNALHIRLLKTIALIDLFKERSGLTATIDLLCACVPDQPEKTISSALDDLLKWSVIIFRKFMDAYAIYAGSDFDIEHAVETALVDVTEVNLSKLRGLANLQPILAKKHYHETGALRWFDVSITSIEALIADDIKQASDRTIGQFLLAIPTGGETEAGAQDICRQAVRADREFDVVIGLSQRSWAIVDLARELMALEAVSERDELAGDAIARREVLARFTDLQSQLETELRRAFESAVWYRKRHRPQRLMPRELNGLASDLADHRFASCPRLHNELLNRVSPSSNAVAAQNALLKRMVSNEGEFRLGIDGFPSEGGLFVSLLERTGLYAHTGNGWAFEAPEAASDKHHLGPLWTATEQCLKENAGRVVTISEIYDRWRRPPFGVKDGLMPVLVIAFILSRRDTIAFYRQGVFQAHVRDLDVEYLGKDPSDIQLRWMDLSAVSRQMLSGMADVVRAIDQCNVLAHLEPIDVARGLVSIFEQLPPWTKRTMRLSANAVRVRRLFKQASDPNKFLFDDIPSSFNGGTIDPQKLVGAVRDGLEELSRAYPEMLHRLQNTMLAELQVPNASRQALAELRCRAENIKELAGDFRLEAFVNRIALFEASNADIEGIASLAADKPLRDWVDADVDRAMIEFASMAQRFNRCEAFARVKGRRDKRHAMAVVVGIGGRPTPVVEEFEIADTDRQAVDGLISTVEDAVHAADPRQRHIILAALAELSARYMQHGSTGAAMPTKTPRTRAARS